MTDKLYVDN